MKELEDILNSIEGFELRGAANKTVAGLAFDSRKVKSDFMFFALPGTVVDGHEFISTAIENGATTVVCQNLPKVLGENITYVHVENSALVLGHMASAFYNDPSKNLKLLGVTGTNGKTTIATLLYDSFLKLGFGVGLISTISYKINKQSFYSSHTTPDQIQLNKLMAEMVESGCEYCFMEVSSHAIHQNRIAGLDFDGALFTNITHDHLDYHKTFAEYIKAKKLFFDVLKPEAFAITNIDDKNGMVMLQNTLAKRLTYSTKRIADFKGKILESHFDGTLLDVNQSEVWTHFIGEFNAYNLLAVYGAIVSLGITKEDTLVVLSNLKPVDGRFEVIRSLDGKYAIVDYAHTPDALENVLKAIDRLRTRNEQVICIAGAGGDRDKTKRPEMAEIACKYSDKIILTSDNPRTEDPVQILKEMEAGVDAVSAKKTITIVDRREAIKTAAMLAGPSDIILIAGKGHEDYQEVNGVKHHFDDREEVAKAFAI